MRKRIEHVLKLGILLLCAGVSASTFAWAQAAPPQKPGIQAPEQPDADHVQNELSNLLNRYPPGLRDVLQADPALLANQSYLAAYPALLNFLKSHPEVERNPSFYVGVHRFPAPNPSVQALNMWGDAFRAVAVFAGFGMAIGLLVWLIRTLVDYRRWSRLAKVQTDVHTKLLDRFTANEDLLAYIQSPAGAKFLESSPITLDAAPKSVGAPMARILWSVQGGVVLVAGGIGFLVIAQRVADAVASQPLNALGVLGIALGLGFVISAIISFVISQRLGLIESTPRKSRTELPGA